MAKADREARIVVVEDNMADIVLLRYALDELDEEYELHMLRDGEEALHFVDTHRRGTEQQNPCVIVLDLHLPRHSGLEVLRAIKRTPPLAHIGVVILTGSASPKEQDEIRELGGACLRKPTELESYLRFAEELMAVCRDGISALGASV